MDQPGPPCTPIVLVATHSYAPGLAALLRSLVQHTRPLPPLFVVDAGLEPQDRRWAEQARGRAAACRRGRRGAT